MSFSRSVIFLLVLVVAISSSAFARLERDEIRLGRSSENPIVSDLHVHYAGGLSTAELLRIGFALKLPYPVSLLREVGAPFDEASVSKLNGIEVISLTGLDPSLRTKLADVMDISYLRVSSFSNLERAYRFRAPLTKNLRALPMILESLALEYKDSGVSYAELSLGDVVHEDWSHELARLAPEIEAKTGVRLKFLLALWRHDSVAKNLRIIEEVFSRQNSEIVGIDIMGEETNDINELAPVFEALRKLKQTRKDFVIQVHAGEAAGENQNLKAALKMGATRIVHGVFGIDQDLLKALVKSKALVILSPTSNVYLKTTESYRDNPVRTYLDHGVRVLPGTDGPGIFNTSLGREVGLLFRAGLTEADLAKMAAWSHAEIRSIRPGNQCTALFSR